ncbi:MAG: hypothetical protein AMXMBFR13_48750 [Phycisphaerae bacterium]
MQSFAWYVRRLRSMSPAEVLWRVQSKVQQSLDRALISARRRPVDAARVASGNLTLAVRSEAVGRELPSPGSPGRVPPAYEEWRWALLERADRIARNRLTLFDLEDHDLGPEIDWNYEYKARRKIPVIFAPAIDYRDYAEAGDCKFAWEPSRHYHLVALGRAYRVSGERSYAEAVAEQIDSWMRQCPCGMGMQWRSPLELAIRMINWVWAVELIRPSGVLGPERIGRILGSVYRHLWDISRKYSRYSSANNHLIGEAAGVFIASSYFTGLHDAPRWRRQSREILMREIELQTSTDGGNKEQAFSYHLFVLEFFLLCGLVARNVGEDFPAEYWDRVEKMFEYLAAFCEGGEPPMYGDADDGYVLDLGNRQVSPLELLAIGAILFNRPDFKAEAGAFGEPAFWLLGHGGYERYEAIPLSAERQSIASRALPETGYYLLQSGQRGGPDRLSVTFDCGELGFGSIAAHGHADALSVTLRVGGHDVLVDPGTYDYFTHSAWRQYFRGTRAHNTVMIDDQDQSEMLGLFLWGRRAQARCLRWAPRENGGGEVVGEHDGYRALPGSVSHRRSVALDSDQRTLTIGDELSATGRHIATWYFHVAPACTVRRDQSHRLHIDTPAGRIHMELDPSLEIALLTGSEDPIGGWFSPGYHRKSPTTTIVARREWEGSTQVFTRMDLRATESE